MAAPSRLEALKTLKSSLGDVAFSTAFGTLFGGAFLVAFVQACHGGDVWLGFLSAVGSLLGVLQIPGAIWGRGFDGFKKFVWPGGLTWRLMYVPIVFLPILAISGQTKLLIAAILIIVGATTVQIVNPIYTDWLAEIVPPTSRGAYFTKRGAIATGVGSGIGIVGGVILDMFQRRQDVTVGLTIIFALGVICGFISFYFFWQMSEHPRPKPIRQPVWQGVKAIGAPFKDRRYRPVIIYLGMSVFATGLPGPFFAAFALDTLKLPFTVITVCSAMMSLSIILFAPLVGFFSDKYGNKPILVIGGIFVAINPFLWVMARDGMVLFDSIYLLCCHLFFGIGWAVVNPSQGNLMLNTAPGEDRANYLGAGNAVIAIISGAAPILGAALVTVFRDSFHADSGTVYRMLFVCSAVLRMVAVVCLIPVREKGSTTLRTTLSQITSSSPRSMRAARRLINPLTPEEKQAVIDDLGQKPSAMAAEGLIAALADPLPKVRRSAAHAISRMSAGPALTDIATSIISHMKSNPDLVEEETLEALEALGRLGENIPGAVDCLSELLRSPRGPIRRAAAHAMGRLGLADAVEPLSQAAEIGDPDLKRAALQALRVLGDESAAPSIIRALRDRHPSVCTAAAEAISEMKLTQAAPVLREILQSDDIYIDGVVRRPISTLAYALGAVGTMDDLSVILTAGTKTVGKQARRSVILGAARILGVESDTYRLLLTEGMNRDTALVEASKPLIKKSRKVQDVLDRYVQAAQHDSASARVQADKTAIQALADLLELPDLKPMADTPVEESFYAAISYACRHVQG